MQSIVFMGISLPLIPFLILTGLGICGLLNSLLPGTIKGLTDQLMFRGFIALLIARVVFIIQHGDTFDSLFQVVDIRDRGFHTPTFAGVFSLVMVHYALTSPQRMQRLVIIVPVLTVWIGGGYGLYQTMNPTPERWPAEPFVSLSGERVQLEATSGSNPRLTLVNLWATWCPSCRTEMPALMKAQQAHPDVRVVLINQGETPQEVAAFLQENGYVFEHLWLDATGGMGDWLGQSALPVTLVFDAQGQLVDGHMGVVSGAVIEELLSR